jgi:hypothetical protein
MVVRAPEQVIDEVVGVFQLVDPAAAGVRAGVEVRQVGFDVEQRRLVVQVQRAHVEHVALPPDQLRQGQADGAGAGRGAAGEEPHLDVLSRPGRPHAHRHLPLAVGERSEQPDVGEALETVETIDEGRIELDAKTPLGHLAIRRRGGRPVGEGGSYLSNWLKPQFFFFFGARVGGHGTSLLSRLEGNAGVGDAAWVTRYGTT